MSITSEGRDITTRLWRSFFSLSYTKFVAKNEIGTGEGGSRGGGGGSREGGGGRGGGDNVCVREKERLPRRRRRRCYRLPW